MQGCLEATVDKQGYQAEPIGLQARRCALNRRIRIQHKVQNVTTTEIPGVGIWIL